MADIEVSIGSVAEIPKGLDKVAQAYAKSVASGIEIGAMRANPAAVTRYQKGVAQYVQKLRETPITAENQREVLQAALATRVYVNQAASVARALGTPAALSIAGMNQEDVRTYINAIRGYDKATERAAIKQERDKIAKANLQDANKRIKQYEALYNKEGVEIFRMFENGDLTKEDFDRRVAKLNVYATRYFAAMRAAGKPLSEIYKNVDTHLENKYDIKEIGDELKDNTDALTKLTKEYRSYIAAGGVGIAAGNYVSNLMKSYYANRKDPYTELGGKIDELIQWGGAGLGAAIGGKIGGIPGAVIGGVAGSVIGGWWNRTRAAAISTQEDAIEQLRWAIKFGGQGVGWQYAQLAEKTGFVKAEEIESLKTASETFGPSVAFGQVSADQWFALAHLPNTFAALNSGADEATLLEAMRADASMYSPGYAMKFFQMAGFSDNLRVLATSGMLESLNRDIPKTQKMAAYLLQATPALVPAYYDRGYEDRVQRMETLKKTIQDAGKEYYNSVGPVPFRMLGGSRSEEDVRNFLGLSQEDWQDRERSSLTPTTININIDGENALKLQGVYTDETALDKNIQYAVGGDL